MAKAVVYRPVDDVRKRVTVYANGRLNDGKALIVPDTFQRFLAEAGKKLSLDAKRLFDIEGKEVKELKEVKPHHLLFVSTGADFAPPVKIDEEEVRRREEARAEEEMRAQAARRHQETMQRIAEEERKRMEEENAAEARRGPLTASTHALFVDQQLTEVEILRNVFSDLRVSRSLPQRIMVRLNPTIEDASRLRLEQAGVSYSVLLVFTCGLRYPKEAPVIEVRWNGLRASLTDLQHAMLQTLLDTKAAELRGTMMLVELIDAAQLWLTGLALNKLKELREAPAVAPASVIGASPQQMAQSSESQLLKQFFSWKYECLSPDAILELQEHEVSYIATQLECDEDLAARLLRHFKWSSQAVLEAFAQHEGDMDALLAAANVQPSPECPPLDYATANSRIACGLCFEEFRVEKLTALACGHWFCIGCWNGYLKTQINEGHATITCPALKCKVTVDDLTVASLVDRPLFKRYVTFGLRSVVQANSHLVWCPNTRGCDNAIMCDEGAAVVTCACGTIFCHQCREPWHWPTTCEMNKWWAEKYEARRRQAEEDMATQEWIRSHSKDCPSCMSPIEKNEGCNHMTCKSCRYEFCWICLVDWECSHYSCKPSDAKKAGHRSASGENYSFLSLYTVENQNKPVVDLMRQLLPGQTNTRVAAGLLTPEQGAIMVHAFQISSFGRELFLNACIMGQYLYANKLPGQRKAKSMCHSIKMNVDILFDLLNTPEKKLPTVIHDMSSFIAAMQGNLTRLKIDVGSVRRQLVALEEKRAGPRKTKYIIVRTPTKPGGKQIERPTSLAALLANASHALGVTKAVVARDHDGNKLNDEDVQELRSGETVHIYTAGDE